MAQASLARRIWVGFDQLIVALAPRVAGELLAVHRRDSGCGGDLRLDAAALVQGLLSVFHARWLCHEPGYRFCGPDDFLSVNYHAFGDDFATVRQGSPPT